MKDKTPIIRINPPPSDMKCECCGKHTSEVPSFYDYIKQKKTDFKLMKNFREIGYTEEDGSECSTISASWECTNCFLLTNEEYWETFHKSHKRKADQQE